MAVMLSIVEIMTGMSQNNLVYSTGTGRITQPKAQSEAPKGDGIIRIRRETKGRKGKGVTTISGFMGTQDEAKKLCTQLKKICGTGGALKNHVIEIQGDNRDKIKETLEKLGHTVKMAGG
jgi:translation initiation factor 1